MKNRFFLMCTLFALCGLTAFGANVDGKWLSEAQGRGGPQTFNLKTNGATLTGTVEGGRGGAIEISNGKVDGDNVSFEVTRDMGGRGKFTMKYTGTVSGDTLKLTVQTGRGPRDIELKRQ